MPYNVSLTRPATKDLEALPKNVLKRVDAAILALADDPHPQGSKKLTGSEDLYRIRVGDYRIIYQVEGGELIVLIIRVRHRREVYR
jgi:mRNA interferase RelE/StbE